MRYDAAADADRLRLCLLFALALHVVLILAIGIDRNRSGQRAPSLDVTLARYHDEEASGKPEFLAQFSQRGSGTEHDPNDPAVPETGVFEAAIVQPVTAMPQPADATPRPAPVLDSRRSEEAIALRPDEPADSAMPPAAEASRETYPTSEVATLVAQLDARRKAYARLPRIERLTSAATREAADAAYLHAWKRRVEAIGNEHYPVEAKRRRLYGELRLLVTLRPDGSVAETRVMQSSGHALLDNAAVQIVRLAAPFDAFPPPIAARADRLEIIRTWQFRSNRLTATE